MQGYQQRKPYNNNRPNSGFNPNNFKEIENLLPAVDWSQRELPKFQKEFYKQGKPKRTEQEIQEYRAKHSIIIKENIDNLNRVPYPFIDWKDTHFPDYIMKAVEKAGFEQPSAIQAQSFPIILSGYDFIGIAQTGSGKTCAFLLPAIVHINAQETVKKGDGPIVLVLAPTRELACQIQVESEKFGRTCNLLSSCIYGGVDKYGQRQKLQDGLDMIIATPGRLIDFLSEGTTNLNRVTYLVLDEADRMLDMGFEPQIKKIVGQIRPDRQTLFFTATWPKEVRSLAHELCHEKPVHIQLGEFDTTSFNKDIKQVYEVLNEQQKIERLIYHLDSFTGEDKVLIFCKTKKGCDDLQRLLNKETFDTVCIHGDKTQNNRDKAIEDFKKNKKRIMIATDVASRGLDIRDVTYVINFDIPNTIEDYTHRIGRTGRAGDKGIAISFFDEKEDGRMADDIMRYLGTFNVEVPDNIRELSDSFRSQKRPQSSYNNYGRGGYNSRGNNRGGYNNSNRQNNFGGYQSQSSGFQINRPQQPQQSQPFYQQQGIYNNQQQNQGGFNRGYNQPQQQGVQPTVQEGFQPQQQQFSNFQPNSYESRGYFNSTGNNPARQNQNQPGRSRDSKSPSNNRRDRQKN